jgi:hypothetical protein
MKKYIQPRDAALSDAIPCEFNLRFRLVYYTVRVHKMRFGAFWLAPEGCDVSRSR